MALEMKLKCEKCGKDTPPHGEAFICSYECTFCKTCALQMSLICSNCQGELTARPKRVAKPDSALVGLGELAGYGLAQAAWTIHDLKQDMVPFAVVVQGNVRKLIAITGFSQEEEISRAKSHLSQAQAHLDSWALVHGSTFAQKVSDGPAIEIDLWTKDEAKAVTVVQSYRPCTDAQSFKLLDDPILLVDGSRASEELANSFFEAAEPGIAKHENASKLWDSWR